MCCRVWRLWAKNNGSVWKFVDQHEGIPSWLVQHGHKGQPRIVPHSCRHGSLTDHACQSLQPSRTTYLTTHHPVECQSDEAQGSHISGASITSQGSLSRNALFVMAVSFNVLGCIHIQTDTYLLFYLLNTSNELLLKINLDIVCTW